MLHRPPRPAVLHLSALAALTILLTALLHGHAPLRAQEEPAPPPVALLDGVILTDDEAATVHGRAPVAVIVDNLPVGARPQIGLDRADLVYELLVEAGITRFMAVYLRQEAAWIEPVRSVRTPFVYLAAELDAVLAHVGAAETPGESDAASQMRDWGVRHLDEQTSPGPFWRDRTRRAPHNAVTSTADIRAEAEALAWNTPSRAASWLFKDDLAVANALGGLVGAASYAFSWGGPPQYDFAVTWLYDPPSNRYYRRMAGRPHADGLTGLTLTAANVVVQFDSARVVNREGHIVYGSLGEGPAYVFLDGQVIEAVWSKRMPEDRTRYWDVNGTEIQFNRGTTWVAVLPYGSPLDWE